MNEIQIGMIGSGYAQIFYMDTKKAPATSIK